MRAINVTNEFDREEWTSICGKYGHMGFLFVCLFYKRWEVFVVQAAYLPVKKTLLLIRMLFSVVISLCLFRSRV